MKRTFCAILSALILSAAAIPCAAADTAIHAQRMIRSAMHGFFAHENAGGFSLMPAEKDESYRLLIDCLHEWLTRNGRHES